MSGRSFEHRLRETRRIVDDVLTAVPQSLLEARRLVTREMSFDPRPEELQAIVRIAGFMSASVVCYELARQMLALRVLAEREWNAFARATRLEPERLAATAATIGDLLDAYEVARQDLAADSAAMATLGDDEKAYLQHVYRALELPHARLEAATVLAPRLERMSRSALREDLDACYPGLRPEERRQILLASRPDETSGSPGASRVCLEAIALRSVLEGKPASADGAHKVRAVYEIVHERLLRQQKEAQAAGLERFAAEIDVAEKRLAQAYHDAVGTGAAASRTPAHAPVTAAERAISDRPKREQVYRAALRKLGFARKRGEHPLAALARRRRRRRMALLAIAASLAIAAAAVGVLLPKPSPAPPSVSLKEFQPALDVLDVRPIGPLLYVRATDWERLPMDRIRFRAAEVGSVAAAHGFAMAYVVSDRGIALAEWHAGGGVLVARENAVRGR